MKKYLLIFAALFCTGELWAQVNNAEYPEPEFAGEVYYLKKDSPNTAVRLEKQYSKMNSKAKLGGFGGYESGYEMDGAKSAVRLSDRSNVSFIFSTGASLKSATSPSDSMMQSYGMDMTKIQEMMGSVNDPANSIILYKVESENGKRKIYLQKGGSAMPFASKKIKMSDKYTFSVKKIRDGYMELIPDKPLSKGEYAFSKVSTQMGDMDGTTSLFAFGID